MRREERGEMPSSVARLMIVQCCCFYGRPLAGWELRAIVATCLQEEITYGIIFILHVIGSL